MDTSVLYSVKDFLGVSIDNCSFDQTIIVYINMALGVLRQLGVESGDITTITGMEEVWFDFVGPNEPFLEIVKSYVCLYTRLLFDPPQNSFLVDSIEKTVQELAWRIRNEFEYISQ